MNSYEIFTQAVVDFPLFNIALCLISTSELVVLNRNKGFSTIHFHVISNGYIFDILSTWED